MTATPEAILAMAASNTAYQQFNPYKPSDPDLKISFFSPETGVGSGFAFDGSEGKGTQTVSAISPSSVTFDIDLGSMGTPTQTIHTAPAEGGTLVTWTMEANMGLNPIARVFGLFMDSLVGKTFDTGLSRLSTATS